MSPRAEFRSAFWRPTAIPVGRVCKHLNRTELAATGTGFSDKEHSENEVREIITGHSAAKHLLLVCFTEPVMDHIRIVSAPVSRLAHGPNLAGRTRSCCASMLVVAAPDRIKIAALNAPWRSPRSSFAYVQIQINSDNTIAVDARVAAFITDEVNDALKNFAGKLTRVEIHLSDVNGPKFGINDKRCRIEVRPAGHKPLTSSSRAASIGGAVNGALTKLQSSLHTFFGRMGKPRGEKVTALKKAAKPSAAFQGAAEGGKSGTPKTVKTLTATANEAPAIDFGERGPKKKGIYRARRQAWPRR